MHGNVTVNSLFNTRIKRRVFTLLISPALCQGAFCSINPMSSGPTGIEADAVESTY